MRDPGEIGRELFYQRRYADALPFLERALRAHPHDGHLHLCLAIALASQGDTARAERHFLDALKYSPNDPYTFYNWGAFLHQQGRYAEAIRAYEQAAQLDPTLVAARTAADGLRRAMGQPIPSPSLPPGGMPSPTRTPANVALPPPATRNGTGWVVLGLLLAVLGGLCPPCLAPLAFLCGVVAIVRGSVSGGILVIVLALVFGVGGLALLSRLSLPTP
ncbi:MAG: tetratricopeptide repeat protein [Armatimonadota bacterium]